MNRRNFLAAMAAPAVAFQAKPRPSVLVLMSDPHSSHMLGCEGDKVVRTPNLDALEADGALFENAYCHSPVCVLARMSFLTGRQSYESRMWTNSDILPSDVQTFAHSFGAARYREANRVAGPGRTAYQVYDEQVTEATVADPDMVAKKTKPAAPQQWTAPDGSNVFTTLK